MKVKVQVSRKTKNGLETAQITINKKKYLVQAAPVHVMDGVVIPIEVKTKESRCIK